MPPSAREDRDMPAGREVGAGGGQARPRERQLERPGHVPAAVTTVTSTVAESEEEISFDQLTDKQKLRLQNAGLLEEELEENMELVVQILRYVCMYIHHQYIYIDR